MNSPAIDTIAAIATAQGRAALGILRVSGPLVPAVACAMLGRLPQPRVALLARFRDAADEVVDQGLALYFPAPQSFTGEHVLELHGHGGLVVQDLLLRRLLELGCRMARPGEFSERAFLNGRMDLAQAEAVADLIDAGSAAAARAAVRSLRGEFSARVAALQAGLTALRAALEAAIDFPDEEIEVLSHSASRARFAEIEAAFTRLADAARQGAVLRDGLTVVIAGRPNAGKSSLLNRLVGDEVAIVSALPGTTRDLLREHLQLDGLPLNLIDTAGLRRAEDAVEAEGIRRATQAMRQADRLLFVQDAADGSALAAEPTAAELESLAPGVPVTLLCNKIDLIAGTPSIDLDSVPVRIHLSAKTGAGLPLLRSHLQAVAGYRDAGAGVLSARRRHLHAIDRAHTHVQAAALALQAQRALELTAEELRLAQRCLGEITGEFTSDDLLGEIFANFCIGK
jgi:tRNA modification GTPase